VKAVEIIIGYDDDDDDDDDDDGHIGSYSKTR